jgi:hypothetical protein
MLTNIPAGEEIKKMYDLLIEELIWEMLELEPKDWMKHLKNHGATPREIERKADIIAIRTAQISAYFGARGANGCGDNGHEEAMKDVKEMRKDIRHALGYGGS